MNAKKCPVWRFDDLDLTNPDSCIAFLVEVVKATWTGELGTRQAGCINNSIRTILTYHLNVKKPDEMENVKLNMDRVEVIREKNKSINEIYEEFKREEAEREETEKGKKF